MIAKEHKNSDDDVCDSEDIQCTSLANEVYIKEERVEFEDERYEIHPQDVAELTFVSNKNPKNQNSNYPVRETLDPQFIDKDTQEATESTTIFSSMSNSNSESEFSEEAEPILPNNLCEVESVAELKSPEMLSVGDKTLVKDSKGKQKVYEGSLKNVSHSPFPNINIPFRDKENIYVCNICDESFKLKEELTRHVIFHYNDRPFPSRISDGYYKRNYEMNQNWHRQLKEGVSLMKRNWAKNHCREIFMCETCGKEYDDKKKLDMHSVRHTNKFSCSFCGKCFGGNRERERHVRIHTQEKPFHCSICEKSFNRKDNLQTHMATHSEQWPSSFKRNTKKLRKST
ncbi:hypothetical protein J437_LFUL007343 [Ladona fulva]|uniref:C2H2-type domain-containing protein n=1 Tax=Ladona fulva TaxID=123851 RepID=A0A8K0P6Q0_LADFU|nr:hypothetical protein J437_LFUL007343 [Ladona fulva]